MSRVSFSGGSTGTIANLDANFTELYDLRDLIRTASYAPATTRLTIDSSGRFLFNAQATWTVKTGAADVIPRMQLSGGATADAAFASIRFNNDSTGTTVYLGHSRGTAVASYAAVNNSDELGTLSFQGADGTSMVEAAHIVARVDGAPSTGVMPTGLIFRTNGGASTATSRLTIGPTGVITPGADNTQTLGSASLRWSTVYAGTGAINTSDAREKTAVRALTVDEIAAAKELSAEIGAFKFLASIAAKGEPAARWHIGMTVQRAIEVMEAYSLDPFAYGFICFDEWVAQGEGDDATPAGDRYAFRPDELLLFIARGFEARLAALEAA